MSQSHVSRLNSTTSERSNDRQVSADNGDFKTALNDTPTQPITASQKVEPQPSHVRFGNFIDGNSNNKLDFNEIHNVEPMTSEQIGKEIANSVPKNNLVNIIGMGEYHKAPPVTATSSAIKQSITNGRNAVALIELPTQQFSKIVEEYSNGSISAQDLRLGMETIHDKTLNQKGLLISQKQEINDISQRIISAKEAGAEVGVFDTDIKTTDNRDATMEQNVSEKVDALKQKGKPTDIYVLTGALHAGIEGDPSDTLANHKSDLANPLIKRLEAKYGDDSVLSVAALSTTAPMKLMKVSDYEAIYILPSFER